MRFLFAIFLVTSAYAEVSSSVFIKGKIGGMFDEKKVKVIDSFGQTYFISRGAFPKKQVIREGAPFQIEIDEKEIIYENKVIKKKK
jgi:hypothetical protein